MERINVRFTDIFNFEAKSDRIIIAVEVNPDGEVFVLTFGNGIKRVEADGNLTDFISGSFFESPLDFAIDSQGKFFVLDNAPLERRVNVFSATGIALPSENLGDGTYGEGVNQFRGPIGIAFDSSDNLYIADHYTGEIEVSDPSRIKIFHKVNGSYINNQFLEFTEIEGVPLNFPYRLAVNNEGLIFVSDLGSTGKGRVLVISIENGIPKLKDLLEGTADSLGSPGDIVVDAVGYIYIADFGDQINLTKILNATNDPSELINYFDIIKNGIRNEVFKIRVYSPQRKYQGFLLEEIDLPLDMALDSCGDLYVNNFELSGTKGTSYLGYVDMNAYLDFDLEIYQRISPADITAPIVSCVAPFAVTLDAIGKASITVDDVDNGSSDNCGIASRTLSKYDFTSADIGVVPVTLTVTDEAGLTATCTVNVTVEAPAEPEAPEATC
ncbi:hypothetical protein, partial [Salinimicrobium xinjiangense]|uniref:hypothetical protein n=1 Tax=Salinimicrobium xinjiangense TaxID=438596 RepID=UPI00056988DB